MSYPSPKWHAEAGALPRAALQEWLTICDHITRAGGRILVLDPPDLAREGAPPDPGLVYMARAGALFGQPHSGGGPIFLLSQSADGAGADPGYVTALLQQAGLTVHPAAHPFAGQANFLAIGKNRFLLTFPEGSGREGLDEIRALLPMGARVLEIALREPHRTGDSFLCPLVAASGRHALLVHGGGLANCTQADLARFATSEIDVIPVTPDDAAAHATSALSVRGNLIVPTGLSSQLRGVLVRHGFTLVEVELPQLLGIGGGGPRSLVSELHGFVLNDAAPSYALRREELHRLVQRYAAM
jgi:hypothetical protein